MGDTTYGLGGDAAPNGGLTAEELEEMAPNPNRVSDEAQKEIADAAAGKGMCVHAKSISFRHPCIRKSDVSLTADASF